MSEDDELRIEAEQVKFWENSLNYISKQFEILLKSINLNLNVQQKRNFYLDQIKTNYKTSSKQFKKEPSHLYFLSDIFFDFYNSLNINSSSKKSLDGVVKTIQDIIQEISKAKNEACKSTFRIIRKCKELILSIKEQENQYQKVKKSLDDAQINQKKIKNDEKYNYEISKKEEADLLLAEKIKKMEKIKKPLEANKNKLIEYKTKLKASLRDNFEIIFSVSFKQLANYYQCLFLILNNKIDFLNNIKGKIDDILIQLSNLIFELNDYSEKKFGETILGIKTEGIAMYSTEDVMKRTSMKQLIEISKHVINYAKIFLICLRYRKKIMKLFLEAIMKINEFEIEYNKEYMENKKALLNELDSLKNVSLDNQKNWRNIILKEKINEIIGNINEICPVINNYIEFARSEHKSFSKNWEKLEEKIKERQQLSIDFINQVNEAKISNTKMDPKELAQRNEKKIRKLKEALKAGLDYIQKNVPTSREKDKNEMIKLESAFEKLFQNFHNTNNEMIITSEDQLNNTIETDIFEECKVITIKYFNRFNIQNYEAFLEKMRIKVLINTNLNEEQLGKGVYKKLSGGLDDNINLSKSNIFFEDSELSMPFDSIDDFQKRRTESVFVKNNKNINPFGPKVKKNDISNINNKINNKSINLKNNDNNNISNLNSTRSINVINNNIINNNINIKGSTNNDIIDNLMNIEGNSNNNVNKLKNNKSVNVINNSIINKKVNLKQNVNMNLDLDNNLNFEMNDNENNFGDDEEDLKLTSNEFLNELENEDNLELMDNNKLSKYTEKIDPYANIKEEELNRLLNMKDEDNNSKGELDEGETKIGSFNCSLSSQIISRGTLLITSKKIKFDSSLFSKVQIIIPLIDIISIKKKTSLGIDNSIEVKTEKVTYLFTSFLSRDYCFYSLKNQINKAKKEAKVENNNGENEENVDENSPEQKYLGKKRFKAKQITKMLEEINFHKRIEEITKERMELFTKEYTDENKGVFMPQKYFKRVYAEEVLKDCPLFLIFTILCNISTQLEEYKVDKGFFESLFLNRGDTEVKFVENPEFSSNVPKYFNNGDYVMNLFSQFNKEDFENFLNEIQNWSHKYEGSCHAVHKVKQVPFGPSQVVMKDRYIAYFISPTLLIFDDMAYATEFTYCDNFIPLFRYRFDCDIKFNEKKGKFEFITKMTISYFTFFLVNFMLKNAVESKSNGDTEETIKGEVLDRIKDSMRIYTERFNDLFDRATDETFQRKIDLKQNMITGEFEEDVIEGAAPEDENVPEENIKENKEEDNKEKENKIEEEGIHKKINEFIDKYKLYIFIGIITVIILGIIYSFFNRGNGSFAVDTIFNLMILGAIFYLFKFK